MLIGLRGFIGAGKDTSANYLVEKHGFVKLSFADTLKDATANIFGWPRELLQGDTDESRKFREEVDQTWAQALDRSDFTPRLALQLMGTEAGRKVFGDNVWVQSTMMKANNNMANGGSVVIADCRFTNETKAIRDAGGKIFWIVRGNLPEWYSSASLENVEGQKGTMKANFPNIHASEWSLVGDPWDALISNDTTYENLYSEIEKHLDI
jgi:hypothetical protein